MATRRKRYNDCEVVYDDCTGEVIAEHPAENFGFDVPHSRHLASIRDEDGDSVHLFGDCVVFTNMF